MNRLLVTLVAACTWALSTSSTPAAAQQQPLVIKPLAELKTQALPAGPLYWRIDDFSTVEKARTAAGPWSLVAESGGKIWLFTLGPSGGSSSGGSKVAEVGPIAAVNAPQYLLRINEASGVPGSITPVHTHPGSEAFYVLAGEQSIRGQHGVTRVRVGQPEVGHGADTPMQVSSTGSTELRALVMFVVDATRPFSSPATLARE